MTAPQFTFSTLGRRGRFANQLFQYLFLRLCAEGRGAEVHTRPWIGQDLFAIADSAEPVEGAVEIAEESILDLDRFLNGAEPIGDRVDFSGYFQVPTRHLRPHRDFIRRLYTFKPAFQDIFGGVMKQLRGTGRPVVAVHLRRSDYGYGHFFRAPARWYADWLEAEADRFPNAILYLCSESPAELVRHFPGRTVVHAGLLPLLPPSVAFLLDFHVMTQADALAISNSSFSFMASMLNSRATAFVRPRLIERDLAPFDPWDAPVLLTQPLAPGEQEELDAVDSPPALVSHS